MRLAFRLISQKRSLGEDYAGWGANDATNDTRNTRILISVVVSLQTSSEWRPRGGNTNSACAADSWCFKAVFERSDCIHHKSWASLVVWFRRPFALPIRRVLRTTGRAAIYLNAHAIAKYAYGIEARTVRSDF